MYSPAAQDVPLPVNQIAPTESAKTGWDLTNLSCTTDGSGSGSTATFNLHAGETNTCTFTNTQRGQIQVVKNTLPTSANGTFNYTSNFGVTSLTTSGGTASALSGYLVPGNGYALAETTPNNGQTGFALVSDTCTCQRV